MTTGGTPAGWYPNPQDPSTMRYWDGNAWTEHVHTPETPAPAPQPQQTPAQQGFASIPGTAPAAAAAGGAMVETPGFIGAYKDVFQNYADFSGRTSVGGYWRFIGMNLVVVIVLFALSAAASALVALLLIYYLAVLVPSLAVAVRRMHDIGKTGWVLLLGLIPLVGAIILLIWSIQSGNPHPNEYGPPPVTAAV